MAVWDPHDKERPGGPLCGGLKVYSDPFDERQLPLATE